ncbi:hypothetical protein IMSAGC007_02420 [Lachnospiraceae bacterium]|nr:hypothetical protein IMSAGC007_02420 [Lachnospiraceae bacterium]
MELIYQITNELWKRILDWMKEEKNQERFLWACFGISLLPILVLSFFNHPVMDDFNYGILTHRAFMENKGFGCIIPILKAAVQRSVNLWHSWQGTFSFAVIGALRPSIFTEKLTFTHTFILLGLFIGGFVYFSKIVLHRILGLSKHVAMIIAVLVMTLCIQYVPVGLEAFYWWIGSIGYTGMFGVMLVLFAMLFLCKYEKRITAKRMAAMTAMAFLLSGGMYPILLLTAVLLVLNLLDVLIGKQYEKSMKIQITVMNVIFFAGFILNVAAPGNSRRQSNFEPRTPVEAVYKSYTKSLEYLFECTNVVIALVMIGLFVYMLYKLKDTKFSFRCPLMFTLVSYSMVVVMWVPAIYAVRFISGGRYYNILYYGVIMFYTANVIYYAGWLRRKYEKCGEQIQKLVRDLSPLILGVLAVFCVILGFLKINIVQDLEEITSATALKSMVYGEAQVYHREIKEREAMYNDPSLREVVVEEVTYRPELLYFGTLTPDPDESRNQAMCDYYDKDYMVKLVPEEEETGEDSAGEAEDSSEEAELE